MLYTLNSKFYINKISYLIMALYFFLRPFGVIPSSILGTSYMFSVLPLILSICLYHMTQNKKFYFFYWFILIAILACLQITSFTTIQNDYLRLIFYSIFLIFLGNFIINSEIDRYTNSFVIITCLSSTIISICILAIIVSNIDISYFLFKKHFFIITKATPILIGTENNPNGFAMHYITSLTFFAFLFLKSRIRYRPLIMIGILINLFILLMTCSRSACLATTLSTTYLLLSKLARSKNNFYHPRLILISIFSILFCFISLNVYEIPFERINIVFRKLSPISHNFIKEKNLDATITTITEENPFEEDKLGSIEIRKITTLLALQSIFHEPLKNTYTQYLYDLKKLYGLGHMPHNLILDMGLLLGLSGMIVILHLIFFSIKLLNKPNYTTNNINPFPSIFIGLLVNNMLHGEYYNSLFWIVFFIILSLRKNKKQKVI